MPSLDKTRKFKPKVLCWVDLTLDHVDEILRSDSNDQTQGILADIFKIKNLKEEPRSGILIDLYHYTIQFAKDNAFTKEQTSAFFSIVKSVHEMAVDTPYGNVEPVFQYCQDLILCHSVKRPPFSVALFSTDQVKIITTYIVNTYFRHYKLYKYAFTPKVRLDLSIAYVGLPDTPVPSEVDEEEGGESEGEEGRKSTGLEDDEVAQTPDEIEETPAVKELKAMISSVLNEQVEQLKSSVESQIKAKDEEISKKMGISLDSPAAPKSPKARGKKGK